MVYVVVVIFFSSNLYCKVVVFYQEIFIKETIYLTNTVYYTYTLNPLFIILK